VEAEVGEPGEGASRGPVKDSPRACVAREGIVYLTYTSSGAPGVAVIQASFADGFSKGEAHRLPGPRAQGRNCAGFASFLGRYSSIT
jgi:hypothetical protein